MAVLSFFDITDNDKYQLQTSFDAWQDQHYLLFESGPVNKESIHPDTEVLSIFVTSKVDRAIIDSLPKLRLIVCRSTGFNNVDMVAASEKKISVVNVPSYGEHTVAEYAFALLLTLSRKIREATNQAKEGVMTGDITGFDLTGKTIGVIGSGRIGQRAIAIAKGFGMNVIAFDPKPNEEKSTELGFSYVSLDDLLANSDIITLHAPYVPANHHLLNKLAFEKMKPGVVLINTARGELVENLALIEALESGKVAGACLDVLEGEALLSTEEELFLLKKNDSVMLQHGLEITALLKMPQVIITKHNAFNTKEAIGRINRTSAENIMNFYSDSPTNVVTPQVKMGTLILSRHAESEWNAIGKWSGSTDVHLSEKGYKDAALLGELIKDIHIDYAFISQQIRTLETLEGILDAAGQPEVDFQRHQELNERDYGDYTGLNKWEVKDKVGEEEFNNIRRNWDHHVPNGETLKDVYARAIPFYLQTIVPMLREGKNVLICAHGNTNRALNKYIESISDEDIANVEMQLGKIVVYTVDFDGKMITKEDRYIETEASKA